jgi:hypothetical protein
MILSQNDVGSAFLLGFTKIMQYLSKFQKYVMEHKIFMGYPERGSACVLSSSRHERYFSNSLN